MSFLLIKLYVLRRLRVVWQLNKYVLIQYMARSNAPEDTARCGGASDAGDESRTYAQQLRLARGDYLCCVCTLDSDWY